MSKHCNWAFSSYKDKKMVYYAINKLTETREMKRIFEMQIPTNLDSLYPKWSDYTREIIDKKLKELIEILPKYMQSICNEHNGLHRMDDFPDFICNHIDCTPTCISIEVDGESLQVGGCDIDDVGEDFTEFFIMGLKGDWQGINFLGCDNPTHRFTSTHRFTLPI